MIEIRYNTKTGELSGLCGDEDQFGNLKVRNEDEVISIVDIPIPEKVISAYLWDGVKLVDNPSHEEPEDWKQLWNAASSTDDKLQVLARKLGMV